MIRLAILLVLWARIAQAEMYPQLFDVTGVAADDVLNVREEPDASSAIIGTLAPDATGVEVTLVPFGDWGRVNTAEMAGYVKMTYLAPNFGDGWGNTGEFGIAPHGMTCFGTEPFWSLEMSTGDETTYQAMGEEPISGTFVPARAGTLDPRFVGFTAYFDDGPEVNGVVEPEACTDGMSDRLYGLSLKMILGATELGQPRLVKGCCSLHE